MNDLKEKPDADKPWGIETHSFCLLMHLAQLAGFVIPGLGIVLPIVMWAANKDEFEQVDQHGKNIVNWILSLLIYSIVSAMLMLIFIGLFLLVILMLLNLIFIIIGAVKASNNQAWVYPMSIRFFK